MVDLDLDAFRKILDTNVVSSLGLVQEAWRAWMAEHGGSVLFVASVAGLRSVGEHRRLRRQQGRASST